MNMTVEQFFYGLSVWALPVLLAVTLHEAGHAYAAKLLGDPTADEEGRVSLDPVKHIDPIGTIALPLMLVLTQVGFIFGWAKPVPVRYDRLRNLPRDIFLVAAAGPAANLVLIIITVLLFNVAALVDGSTGEWLRANLDRSLAINIVLMVFNLLPIPPLDGSKMLACLLPAGPRRAMFDAQANGMAFLMGFFVLSMLGEKLIGFNLFTAILGFFYTHIMQLVIPFMGLFKYFG